MSRSSFLTKNPLAVLAVLVTACLLATGGALRARDGINAILGRSGSSAPAPVELIRPAISLGMFDPDEQFSKASLITVDHFYFNWVDYRPNSLESDFRDSKSRHRTPLITIEPHAYPGYPNLLQDVAAGSYDGIIRQICTEVGSYDLPVLLRWGPKMESPRSNAAWAGKDPDLYKRAYQRFVSTCRSEAANAQYVWSPAGSATLASFWPGSLFADYVGLSLFADPQLDREVSGSEVSFSRLFREAYDRVAIFNRPIIVAELGVAGDSQTQKAWLEQALRDMVMFPLVKAAVYYNTIDSPETWDSQYPIPDWRVSNDTLLGNIEPKGRIPFETKPTN